ncbi:MAG: hypothetical protein M1127_01725 [Patescibacteria group bacterium]|nr:hypothetical protein [Patescibacteria group bacterium]
MEKETVSIINDYIQSGQKIHILASPDFQSDSLPASLALFYSLKEQNPNTSIIAPDFPTRFSFLAKQELMRPLPQADFLVSIKESGAKLSRLFYEKTSDGLNLLLKTSGVLKKENVVLKPVLDNGLLITVGVADLRAARSLFSGRPAEIIDIDRRGTSSISEVVFDLLCCVCDFPLPEPTIDCLFTGLLQNPPTEQRTKAILRVLEQKSSHLRIALRPTEAKTENIWELFELIVGKLRFFLEQNLGWASVRANEFKLSGSGSKDLKFSLQQLSAGLFPFQSFLILWEQINSPIEVKGVFYSLEKTKTQKLAKTLASQRKGPALLFSSQERNLEAAKSEIFSLLNC